MRTTFKMSAFATLTAFAVLTGCNSAPTTTGPGGDNNPTNPGSHDPGTPPTIDPGTPDPNMPAAPVAKYDGVYDVKSLLDFTQGGVLPGITGPALGGLSELHDHPGDAIYTILAGASIPYLSDILNKVPSFLKKALTGALDDLIIKNLYQGYPVADQVATIIQGIAELSKQVNIHDYLTVGVPNHDNVSVMEHQLTSVDFTYLGAKTTVLFSAAAKANAYAKVNGTILPHTNAPVADADISIPGGTFKLPIGEMMLSAAGPLLFVQFGGATDLTSALVNLVPCATFAQDISDGVNNVINAADVQTLCEGALGLVAQQVENQIKAITLDNVVLSTVNGKLYDTSMKRPAVDYQSDRIAEGKGSWSFTINGGSATVPSAYAGDRIVK